MLTDLVLKNRSYRGYNKSRKVTKEELMELVDIARLCPSSANIQPLCYSLAWEAMDEVQGFRNRPVGPAQLHI